MAVRYSLKVLGEAGEFRLRNHCTEYVFFYRELMVGVKVCTAPDALSICVLLDDVNVCAQESRCMQCC